MFLSALAVLALVSLHDGESIVFSRGENMAITLLRSDEPVIRLVETDGADAVVRVAIDQASRLVVLRPHEQRLVRLRKEFAESVLRGTQVRVEILSGRGGVRVLASELRPLAGETVRRRAVRSEILPTSFALIDQAESSGAIDSETALLYRVYSLFSDVHLPAQYRGDDRLIPDSLYLTEARLRYETLSPAVQALVRPFLIPPAYEDSWVNLPAGTTVAPMATPPPCHPLSPAWAFVDAPTVPVRVWYRIGVPQDGITATTLASEIDRVIWPKIAGLMSLAPATAGRPIPDLNEACNGGDGRLDIYLVDLEGKSFEVNYSDCKQNPSFIELSRSASKGMVAHEIFHAFQSSYPLAGCMTDRNYNWWTEGSATWAAHFVYPRDDWEHQYAPNYLSRPKIELDVKDKSHEYGTYLLPFFVELTTGNPAFVRSVWQGCSNQPAIEAFDQAVPGGFERVWPEFVKYNWNREPIQEYVIADLMSSGAVGTENQILAQPQESFRLGLELPHLSADYRKFTFDPAASSVIFWNGVTTKLAERDITNGLLGPQYVNEPASGEEKKGAHVRALIRIGETWSEEDWTNLPFRIFCRDLRSERIDELVLIISNSEFKDRNRKLKPPGLTPILYASNMGCWRWKGEATFNTGAGATFHTDVTFTRIEATQENPSLIEYEAQGAVQWTINQPPACNASGTSPIGESTLKTYNYMPTQNLYSRSYVTGGIISISACGGSGPAPWLLFPPIPVASGIPFSRFVKVGADGKTMDDSFVIGTSVSQWHFVAQRE